METKTPLTPHAKHGEIPEHRRTKDKGRKKKVGELHETHSLSPVHLVDSSMLCDGGLTLLQALALSVELRYSVRLHQRGMSHPHKRPDFPCRNLPASPSQNTLPRTQKANLVCAPSDSGTCCPCGLNACWVGLHAACLMCRNHNRQANYLLLSVAVNSFLFALMNNGPHS